LLLLFQLQLLAGIPTVAGILEVAGFPATLLGFLFCWRPCFCWDPCCSNDGVLPFLLAFLLVLGSLLQ
jgi:hypothetical protein